MSAIALDPLIVEAKRRARLRRFLALGAIALVAAAAVGTTLVTRLNAGTSGISGAAARHRVRVYEVGSSGGGVVSALAARNRWWLTTDDGRSWRRAPGTYDSGFPDFVDRRHGWVVTDHDSGLARTVDGGRTWQQVSSPGRRIIDGARFVSPTVGFVDVLHRDTRANDLFATHDGGITWHARTLPWRAQLARFVTARHGFAATRGTIFSTVDGGRTWSVLLRHHRGCGPFDPLRPPAVFGRTIVVACQYWAADAPRRLPFYVSNDGGSTWTVRRSPRLSTQPNTEFDKEFSARTWLISTAKGVFVTTSAGRTWHLVRPVDLPRHWTLLPGPFSSRTIGWALFTNRYPWSWQAPGEPPAKVVLMRTTDGGRHWKPAGPLKPLKARARG